MVRRDGLAAVVVVGAAGASAAVRAAAVGAGAAADIARAAAMRPVVRAVLVISTPPCLVCLLAHASPFLRLIATSVVERPAHASARAGRTPFHRYVMKSIEECQ